MKSFGLYSRYYDLLYKEKDYLSESAYIDRLIKKYSKAAENVLELGCGTGLHAIHMAGMNYNVCGVDLSDTMLQRAERRIAQLSWDVAKKVKFLQGDARSFRDGILYDVVVSLFHVVSYQISNQDLTRTFETAARHLKPGGLFIFDYWYGPAVLNQKPEVRVKKLQDDEVSIIRTARPSVFVNENRVQVDYSINMASRSGSVCEEIHESHHMRYLFLPEIEMLAKQDFQVKAHLAWMSTDQPGVESWAGVSVLERQDS